MHSMKRTAALVRRRVGGSSTGTRLAGGDLVGLLRIADRVSRAGAAPAVALESAVITHGLPYPHNLRAARRLESIVREHGCEPATVALIDGQLVVGVSDDELRQLAGCAGDEQRGGGPTRVKVAGRDLAYHLCGRYEAARRGRLYGGTTVSATLHAAHAAGIDVFATGGIGGVHRGAETSFDVSSDLVALSRTPVAIVCAGVKSILDVAKTLEFLETHGVPVVVYGGDGDELPGFYTPKSGMRAPYSTDSLRKVASIIESGRAVGLRSGTLVACPIPAEHVHDAAAVEAAIRKALDECTARRISKVHGRAVTPYVLQRVAQLTGGATVTANVALLENNAAIASRLALELHHRRHGGTAWWRGIDTAASAPTHGERQSVQGSKHIDVLAVGACMLDVFAAPDVGGAADGEHGDGGTRAGRVSISCGGVARNHADAAARLGHAARLLTAAAADDGAHDYIKLHSGHVPITFACGDHDAHADRCAPADSAAYVAVHDARGHLLFGVSNVDTVMRNLSAQQISCNEDAIKSARIVVADGNLTADALGELATLCSKHSAQLWFDPADASKVSKLFASGANAHVRGLAPNLREFAALLRHAVGQCASDGASAGGDTAAATPLERLARAAQLGDSAAVRRQCASVNVLDALGDALPKCDTLLLKMAGDGALVFLAGRPSCLHVPSPDMAGNAMISVSGAGDCFNAGYLSGVLRRLPLEQRCELARRCASCALAHSQAVPASLRLLAGTAIAPRHH